LDAGAKSTFSAVAALLVDLVSGGGGGASSSHLLHLLFPCFSLRVSTVISPVDMVAHKLAAPISMMPGFSSIDLKEIIGVNWWI
jgi:hypothetical protein